MARIELKDVAHAYADNPVSEDDYALKRLNLKLEDGVAYALLGASGCGKTTLLNTISGLITPSEGQVLFDGKDVTGASPRDRHIAQVFQFPVVYDTMTVAENLSFPLKNRGVSPAEQKRRVDVVAEALGLERRLASKPSALPLGLRQLIALGRGLVREDVNAILFDEPLTVIDPQRKLQLRTRLRYLHERFDVTMIYVTHDQTEALTFADQVMVMNQGQIIQTGSPQALFENPETEFVGHFVGSPGMNFLRGQVREGHFLIGDERLELTPPYSKIPDGKEATLGIRPEFIELSDTGYALTVGSVQNLGDRIIVSGSLQGQTLKLSLAPETPVTEEVLYVQPDTSRWALFVDGVRYRS